MIRYLEGRYCLEGGPLSVGPILIRLRALGMGVVLVLGLAACIAAPEIVGPLHPPISPAKVKVFKSPPFNPPHYTVVARLDAAWYGGCDSPKLDRIVLAKFRRQAARLGANGILLILSHRLGHPSVVDGVAGPCFSQPLTKLAEAIYVWPEP